MLPRELRTWIIKRMTSRKVKYVQDGTCVQYGLCLYLFVVAWRDSPISEYLNTPPEARHCQRERTEEKMNGRTREKWNNDHPLELNIPKCDQPKHPKNTKRNFPQSKPRSKNMNWWSNRNTWPWVAVRGVLTNQQTCSEVFHMTQMVISSVAT